MEDTAAVDAIWFRKQRSVLDFRDRTVVDPEVRFGNPTVRGTRIAVGDVLDYLAGGMSEDQVRSEFPQLSREDSRACLAFAPARDRSLSSVPGA